MIGRSSEEVFHVFEHPKPSQALWLFRYNSNVQLPHMASCAVSRPSFGSNFNVFCVFPGLLRARVS